MEKLNLPPLLILDFRVSVYILLSYFEGIKENYSKATQQKWLKAAWAIFIHRGFTGLPFTPSTIVIADDAKPYWRSKYLEERGFPAYKGGRKEKGHEWYEVAEAGKDYILDANSNLNYLCFVGYEADDIASALVRIGAPRLNLLYTIDSDWQGLVNDGALKDYSIEELLTTEDLIDSTTVWTSQRHWQPRFRDEAGVRTHTLKRTKVEIDKPPEVWSSKVGKGDKADNLLPNSPIEVIDLLEPPSEFDLLKQKDKFPLIKEVAYSTVINSNFNHLTKAVEWFKHNGFTIPVYGFNQFPLKKVEKSLAILKNKHTIGTEKIK